MRRKVHICLFHIFSCTLNAKITGCAFRVRLNSTRTSGNNRITPSLILQLSCVHSLAVIYIYEQDSFTAIVHLSKSKQNSSNRTTLTLRGGEHDYLSPKDQHRVFSITIVLAKAVTLFDHCLLTAMLWHKRKNLWSVSPHRQGARKFSTDINYEGLVYGEPIYGFCSPQRLSRRFSPRRT